MIKHFKKLMYECFPSIDDKKSITNAYKTETSFGVFEQSTDYDMYNCDEDIVMNSAKWTADEIKIAAARYRDPRSRPAGWTAYDCILQTITRDNFDWFHTCNILSLDLSDDDLPPYPLDKELKPFEYEHYIDYKKKHGLTSKDKIDAFLKESSKTLNGRKNVKKD